MHVTYGVEVDEESTWAALLHIAVAASAASLAAGCSTDPQQQADPPKIATSATSAAAAAAAAAATDAAGGEAPFFEKVWESSAPETLACETLLHVWIKASTVRRPILRKACPLLASDPALSAILAGVLLEVNKVRVAPLPPQQQQQQQQRDQEQQQRWEGSRGDCKPMPAHDGPRSPLTLLNGCWEALYREAFGDFSMTSALDLLLQPQQTPGDGTTPSLMPVGGDRHRLWGQGESDPYPEGEGYSQMLHSSQEEALAWRQWLSVDETLSSGGRDDDLLHSTALFLLGSSVQKQKSGTMSGKLHAMLHAMFSGPDIVKRVAEVWCKVMGSRVRAASDLERAFRGLHGHC